MDDTSRRVGEYEWGDRRLEDKDRVSDVRRASPEIEVRARSAEVDVTGHEDGKTEQMDPDSDQRASDIRHQIERTRDEMSETIDAIQDKLSPRNIVAHATERVKTATTERVREMASTAGDTAHDMMDHTRDTAGGIVETIRQNPIPAALVGLGAAWLLMNRSESRHVSADDSGGDSWRDYRGYSGTYGKESRLPQSAGATRNRAASISDSYDGDDWSGVMGRVRSNPVPAVLAGLGLGWLAFAGGEGRTNVRSGGYGRTDDYRRSSGYADRWSEGAADDSWDEAPDEESNSEGVGAKVSESAERIASRAKEYAGDTTDALRRRGRRAQSQLQRMMQDSPLLVGAGALMLGAAFGLAVPETETENEWMGDARDTVVERAQEMARSAASQVQDAAGQATDAISNKQE